MPPPGSNQPVTLKQVKKVNFRMPIGPKGLTHSDTICNSPKIDI